MSAWVFWNNSRVCIGVSFNIQAYLFLLFFVVVFGSKNIRNRFDKIQRIQLHNACWPSHCSQTSSWRGKSSHLFTALCAVSFVSLIENQNNRVFSSTKVRIWKHLHKRQSSWITAASFLQKQFMLNREVSYDFYKKNVIKHTNMERHQKGLEPWSIF